MAGMSSDSDTDAGCSIAEFKGELCPMSVPYTSQTFRGDARGA